MSILRMSPVRSNRCSPIWPRSRNICPFYLAAKADQWKVSASAGGRGCGRHWRRRLLLTIPIVAAALLLNGCAEAIGVMAGGRSWAANWW